MSATAPLLAPTATRAPVRIPPVPESVQQTGIPAATIVDLLLKTLYVQGSRTGDQLTECLRLPFSVLDELLLSLQQRRLVEVRSGNGPGRVAYAFDLTGAGRERARDAMEASQYVGPVPVPLAHYRYWLEAQSIRNVHVTRSRIQEGFRHMVLDHSLFEMLGPAINSAKSLFLYGDPGNGKTMIAESIAAMVGGPIFVPHAIDVGGQTVVLLDPIYHRPVRDEEDRGADATAANAVWRPSQMEYDRRYERVRRPVVMVGGELMLEQLDLQYDRHTKVYQAPFQVKANGGVLIIDDFGRQRVPARDLLNRWIVPLERRIDFLTLHTGGKFPVPFDCLLVFATNLKPQQLVEEAFMRRIHYKLNVGNPTREQYTEILRLVCGKMGVPFRAEAVDYIYREFYAKRGIPARACHPRDILDHVLDAARFWERAPDLTDDLLDQACTSYFLELTDPDGPPSAITTG